MDHLSDVVFVRIVFEAQTTFSGHHPEGRCWVCGLSLGRASAARRTASRHVIINDAIPATERSHRRMQFRPLSAVTGTLAEAFISGLTRLFFCLVVFGGRLFLHRPCSSYIPTYHSQTNRGRPPRGAKRMIFTRPSRMCMS